MASNNITFKIGTVFSGEGFKKARNEVNEMNQSMKKGVAAASQMAGALGGLDQSASKAMTAMTGMLQSLLTFNATAILSQAAMVALSMWTKKMNDEAAALTERMNALKESCEKAFAAAIQERMASVAAEVKSISSGFESLAKQAAAFSAALEGVRAASAQGGIAQLQVDKLNAMLDAHTEAERQNVEKSYDLLIAQAKLTEAEQSGSQKIEAATEAYETNKKRVANIDEQLAVLAEERKSLEETMLSAKASNDGHWVEIQKRVNALKEQEEDLLQKRNDTEAASDVLELKVQQAKEEANTAILNATATVKQAELAEKKLAEAADAKAYADKKAADEAELNAAAAKREREEKEKVVELQKEVNDSALKLKKAQEDYAKALSEYNGNFTQNTITEALKDVFKSGKPGTIPVDVQKSVQTKVADHAVDEAIRNGLVNSVKDADKLARQAARDARNELNKGSGQRAKEAAKYERLMKQQPKNWSKQDADFVAKFEKIKAAAEKQKADVEKAKKALDDAKKHQADAVKNLDKIVKKLDVLGLK